MLIGKEKSRSRREIARGLTTLAGIRLRKPSPGLRSECMVQVLRYEKGGNLIMRYIVKSLAGQILHFKAFPRISPIVVIRLCEIYGMANLLIVARNIAEQVDVSVE